MGLLNDRFFQYVSAEGRNFNKHLVYGPIYEKYLEPYRGKKFTLVEVGVGKGGNLQVWKEYFGPNVQIWGIDILDRLVFEDPQMKFLIGDQGDPEFLATVHKHIPVIDVLIDDGSHVSSDQIKTFEALFPLISSGGLYFCEDCHTSYREKEYNGGYLKEGTFIEYCKKLVDQFYYLEDTRIPTNGVTTNQMQELAFYLTMVVIRKMGANHIV